jgi:hypothetical protein
MPLKFEVHKRVSLREGIVVSLRGLFREHDLMNECEKRHSRRVRLDSKMPARMMGIDGTWQRECVVDDISDGGAKLTVFGSIGKLPLQEFFLVLSSTGLAYRHCKLAWVNGEHTACRSRGG